MRKVHPNIPVFELSAKTGEGFEQWIEWLKIKVSEKSSAM
jgi:hydrogenase nickel incorporation protein HypB